MSDTASEPPPPAHVLEAFRVPADSDPAPITDGSALAWRAAGLVLKRAGHVVQDEWVADLFESLLEDGFRVARPVRADDGTWVVDGWCAWRYVTGEHDTATRWRDVLDVGRRFHAAIRDVARPAFLATRQDPWSSGDRVAWQEEPVVVARDEFRPLLDGYVALLRPSTEPAQLVHGDLTANVLFADPEPPAVIDFSPYWRPVGYALAIVVVDAISWHGADAALTDELGDVPDAMSMLARAAIFRLVTSDRAAAARLALDPGYVENHVRAHRRLVDVLERRAPSP